MNRDLAHIIQAAWENLERDDADRATEYLMQATVDRLRESFGLKLDVSDVAEALGPKWNDEATPA